MSWPSNLTRKEIGSPRALFGSIVRNPWKSDIGAFWRASNSLSVKSLRVCILKSDSLVARETLECDVKLGRKHELRSRGGRHLIQLMCDGEERHSRRSCIIGRPYILTTEMAVCGWNGLDIQSGDNDSSKLNPSSLLLWIAFIQALDEIAQKRWKIAWATMKTLEISWYTITWRIKKIKRMWWNSGKINDFWQFLRRRFWENELDLWQSLNILRHIFS